MGQLDPQRTEQQLVVGAFQGEAEAELAATMLAARGITAAVSFGDVDAAFPSLSFVRGFRVIVDAEHAEEARLLLNPPDDVEAPPVEPPA